eukprot:UN27093
MDLLHKGVFWVEFFTDSFEFSNISKISNLKQIFTLGKMNVFLWFVNCPPTKKHVFRFTIDNIFFVATY